MEGEEKLFAQRIYDQVEQYAKTTIELYKLRVINTVTDVFATTATGLIVWVIFSMFLCFVSIGAAFYFGELLGKWHYGFFLVAGFYALVGVIVYILRVKYVKNRISDFIVKEIFKD